MTSGAAPGPALAQSSEAITIAESGSRRNAAIVAPIATGTATEGQTGQVAGGEAADGPDEHGRERRTAAEAPE
jgi:hypothetical protein